MSHTHLNDQQTHTGRGRFMIYAGMEDGLFSGYGLSGEQGCSTPGEPRCTTWYTDRKAGRARPQDYPEHWRSLAEKFGGTAPWQLSACATGRSDELYGCRADPSLARSCTDPSRCRAHETAGGTTCAMEAACKTQHKVGEAWETKPGAYLAESCVDATAASTSIDFAQQTCGHSDCVDVTPGAAAGFLPGCQDSDVRFYYRVGCGASDLQNDQGLCEASGATCSVALPAAFSLKGVDAVNADADTVELSTDDATVNRAGQILTLDHASGSSAAAISDALVATIDASAANTVTLAAADSTISAGQVLQLSGSSCAAQPLDEDLVVASVDGAVITFATALTAGDSSANANCVITRSAPFPLKVGSYSGQTITIDTSTTSIDAPATAGNCVISRAQDERQCQAYAGDWTEPCTFSTTPLTSSQASIASVDAVANSITVSAAAASSFVPGQRVQLADKPGQTCAAQPKGSDLVVQSVVGPVIKLSTDLTGADVNAGANCVITRISSCAETVPGRFADAGPHIDRPYRWRSYDPRYRLWYRQAKERFFATATQESWSDLYLFASGQGIGLTAMRVVSDASWCEGNFCSNCAAAAVGPQDIAANGIDAVANTITLDIADTDITAGQTLRLSSAAGQSCTAAPLNEDLVVESVDGAVVTLATLLTNGDDNANVRCQVTHNGAKCRATDAHCVGSTSAKQASATRADCESVGGEWVEPCVYTTAGSGACSGTPFAGVLAVDYALTTLGNWLKSVIPSSDDIVVWVVDQRDGAETSAGTIIAASQGSGLDPTTHSSFLLRKSSEHLTREFGPYSDWPVSYSNSTSPDWLATTEGGATVRQLQIEVQALGDTRGLSWLVVVATIEQRSCERSMQASADHLECECKPNFRTTLPSDIVRESEYEEVDCVFCKADRSICCAEAEQAGQKCETPEVGCINCHRGSRVTARRGFFLVQKPEESLQVFRCLEHLCLGIADTDTGNSTNFEPRCSEGSENMTSGNCCAKGHEGLLCGLCKDGYAWSDDMKCVPCSSPDLARVFMIVSSLLLFITYAVLSKHYFIVKKATSGKPGAKLKHSSCFHLSSWCFFVPLGSDLPESGGSELQTLTFWMQSFSLLEIRGNESWWWILSMVFHFKPSSGVKVCPYLLTPFEKWWVDVFGPSIFLLCTAFIMHCMICLHMAYRGSALPCSRRTTKKLMLVRGVNDSSEEDITKLFDGMKCPGFVTHVSIRYRSSDGENHNWALVRMSEDVDIASVEAELAELKESDSRLAGSDLSVDVFDRDVARKSAGAMSAAYYDLTFRAHFWSQSHKLKAVLLDVAIYSLMPVMTKSLVITHCRSDTPDGISRVIRLPEIACEGSTYVLTYVAAVLMFVLFGFGLPLWLGWHLYLRVDAPAAELEKHSIWVGDPHCAFMRHTDGAASTSIGKRLQDKLINICELVTGKDIDGDGDVGNDGSAATLLGMWQRLFYLHLGAARAGHPSDVELIAAWEYRAGATAVSNSGVFEFDHQASEAAGDAFLQSGIRASARGLKSGLSSVKRILVSDESNRSLDDRFHNEEQYVLSGGKSSNAMRVRELQTGHVKAWLQHPDTEATSSIADYRSKLRDEEDYETLVRWAYEMRIREVFRAGVKQHEGYQTIVAKQVKEVRKLADDDAEQMVELLKQTPILTVELQMMEVLFTGDDRKGRDDCLRNDLVKLDREKLCARANRDGVEISDGDTDSAIIEKIVKAYAQAVDSGMVDGATVLVPDWAVVAFKQPATADFALNVAAAFEGLTSSRTGETETEILRSDMNKNTAIFSQHLRTIIERFPTTLHAQAFDCEGANTRTNRPVWLAVQSLLERYQKHQTSKVMLSLAAVLEALGSSSSRATAGKNTGGGRGGAYLRSVYWSTMANGARSRRDWLLPMYSGVDERCWWWSAALLFRRTAIALFSSRRDGQRFQVFGTDSDWRAMVVLTLSINIFLSSVYRPYKISQTNAFSDFSIVVLLVLYMFTTSGEEKFFVLIALLGAIVLLPSLGLLMWKNARRQKVTKEKWDRLKVATKGVGGGGLSQLIAGMKGDGQVAVKQTGPSSSDTSSPSAPGRPPSLSLPPSPDPLSAGKEASMQASQVEAGAALIAQAEPALLPQPGPTPTP